MITTQESLDQAMGRLQDVAAAIASLETEYPNASPSWRAALAEGWVEQARQLQEEIKTYTGFSVWIVGLREMGCDFFLRRGQCELNRWPLLAQQVGDGLGTIVFPVPSEQCVEREAAAFLMTSEKDSFWRFHDEYILQQGPGG